MILGEEIFIHSRLTLQASAVAPQEARKERACFPKHAGTLSRHVKQGSSPDTKSLHTVKHDVQLHQDLQSFFQLFCAVPSAACQAHTAQETNNNSLGFSSQSLAIAKANNYSEF